MSAPLTVSRREAASMLGVGLAKIDRLTEAGATETLRAKCDLERKRGLDAKARLVEIMAIGEMHLDRQGRDRYGRTLARVFVDGRDVARILIDEGLARPYSGGKREGWCDTH